MMLYGVLIFLGYKIIIINGLSTGGTLGRCFIGLTLGIPLAILFNSIFDLFPSTYKARKNFRWNDRE